MRDSTPQAVQACHELLLWVIPQLDRFPRLRRFTLGERLETVLLEVLDMLVEAAYSRAKEDALRRANRRLEVARHLWRLAHELQAASARRYEHGARLMDDLDDWVKEQCRAPAYLRYVDDMVLLDDGKKRLAALRQMVGERLAAERLRLHPRKAHISPTQDGLSLLGYVVTPRHRRLRADNGRRFARRLRAMARAYASGRIAWPDIRASVQSWLGHARHADTFGLRRSLLCGTVFRRGSGP